MRVVQRDVAAHRTPGSLSRACATSVPLHQVEIDHFVPLHSYLWRLTTADPNAWANLQPLCPNCHAAKSQQERMRMPTGSSVPCACGATHSTYFMPTCSAMREQVLLVAGPFSMKN